MMGTLQKFFQQKFIGPVAGIEMRYNVSKQSRLGIAYARSVNSKEIQYSGTYIGLGIKDWHFKHTDKFFMKGISAKVIRHSNTMQGYFI